MLVVGGCCVTSAMAQDAVQRSGVEQLDQVMREAERQYQLLANPALTPTERAFIDYGALANFALLAIDDINGNTHMLRLTDLQAYGLVNIDGAHEFYGRLRYTYQDFNEGDNFELRNSANFTDTETEGDESLDPLADRWWYKFDLANAVKASEGRVLENNLIVQAGRQYVVWASGLTLSEQLYAVRGEIELGDFEFEGLAAMTPSSSVIDFDSSRPDFADNTDRNFFGAKLAYEGIPNHRPYAYVLHQSDQNDEDRATLTVVPAFQVYDTRFEYDSTYFAIGSTGTVVPRLNYIAEIIHETGDSASSSLDPVTTGPAAQTIDDISAWAGKLELHYLVRDENLSRLEFEVLGASGDDDRRIDTSNTFGGNRAGTKDRAFNAFGFDRTGLAFAAPISNILMFRAGASTFPFRTQRSLKHLQVGVDLLWFNKMDADAPLDEPTEDHRYLGFETDLFVNWLVTSDVAVNVRYGVFFPGEGIASEHDARHFVYTGITYGF